MVKIQIKGPIVDDSMGPVYDFLKRSAAYPKKVIDALPEDGSDIELDINSGGGLVDSGSEIYTALRNYAGKVTVNVVGLAASAASIVAMAGDEVVMSPVAQLMIHNVSAGVVGDNRDHAHIAEVLENANHALAGAYVAKTGMDEKDILDMMNKETWLTAQQAVDKGFADKVMFDELALTASTEELMTADELDEARALMNQINKPKPPVIHPTTAGITGHGLANAYIKADNHEGKKIAEGHADADGDFSLKVKLNPGDEVRVTQADKWGTSKPAVANVPGGKTENAVTVNIMDMPELQAKLAELQAQIDEQNTQTVHSNWNESFFI